MYLDYYLELLNYSNIPKFLVKYLEVPSLIRLKKVGYFCGMDYASKDIYDFREYISRFDHSLSVALLTYMFTNDKKSTIAALFHDIATPCFSHVIDYMNKDYEKQESTEEYTAFILSSDEYLRSCLEEDDILIEDIINFKKYSIVDNDRPKVCADRIDGVILTGIGWTKNITKLDIKNILRDMCVFKNEFGEEELGFKTYSIACKVLEVSNSIDYMCHSVEDNYMMDLLAKITKRAIELGVINYEQLFIYNEEELFSLFNKIDDELLKVDINKFKGIKKEEVPVISIPSVKVRDLNPLVGGLRLKDIIN